MSQDYPERLQDLFKIALDKLQRTTVRGYTVASVLLQTDKFVGGLATLAARLIDLTESDVLLLGHQYPKSQGAKINSNWAIAPVRNQSQSAFYALWRWWSCSSCFDVSCHRRTRTDIPTVIDSVTVTKYPTLQLLEI